MAPSAGTGCITHLSYVKVCHVTCSSAGGGISVQYDVTGEVNVMSVVPPLKQFSKYRWS